MTKFLKLLDPRAVSMSGPEMTIAEQAELATEMFPSLVDNSSLHYWNPGDSIMHSGTRYLIGVAANYALEDLRLLDLINGAANENAGKLPNRIDVFNIANAGTFEEISHAYFADAPIPDHGWNTHPIIGIWHNGVSRQLLVAHEAMKHLLSMVDTGISVEQLIRSVRPPNPQLME